VDDSEIPKLEYAPTVNIDESITVESIRQSLIKKLQKKKQDEYRLRSTLAGPHRDEFVFSLSGMQLKQYASQGQHKTFLIALKTAEFFYLKERCNENPVFLLDDVFSELDEERSAKLLSLVEKIGQTFITTTSEKVFGGSVLWNNERRKFIIRNGSVIREALAA
jgi:DNA replication and repair protein RecF